jgi:hypothetical protein
MMRPLILFLVIVCGAPSARAQAVHCAQPLETGKTVEARDLHVYLRGNALVFDVCVAGSTATRFADIAVTVTAGGLSSPTVSQANPQRLPQQIVRGPGHILALNGTLALTDAGLGISIPDRATVVVAWRECAAATGECVVGATGETGPIVLDNLR